MSLFGNKNKTSYKLIISLKSSSIDLQLVKSTPNQIREVVFAVRNIILLKNSSDSSLYTKQYSKELSTLISKNILSIKRFIKEDPFTVEVMLYTPWFTSKIDSISHKESIMLDDSFLNTKINKIISKTKTDLKTIEKRIVKIQVNGYTLTDFIKVKSSNLKIDVYTSYISNFIYTNFKKIITDNFPELQKINFHTSPLLFLDRIKEFMIQEDNLSVIYVGGEITELSIIKEDSLVYFATFPIGKHDFLRSIQDTVQTYDYSLLDQKQIQIKSKKQENQLQKIKKDWAQSICDLMQNLNQNIPSKVLIVSDSKTLPFFTKLFTDSIAENPNSILKNHRIINFDISTFKDIISYKTPGGDNEMDLIIEALI